VNFGVTGQVLTTYSALFRYFRKNENTTKQCHISLDLKSAHDSVRREVLYDIFIGFGIPMKLVRLIKTCLNETYNRVRVGKYLSDMLPIRKGLKQGDALKLVLFNFVLEYAIRWVQ
jgi:hypothetical protein